MGPLSDIFGGSDESSNTNSDMSDSTADVTNTLGLDASSSSESWEQDEDGNASYDSTDNSLSLDNDTDSLLSNVSDSFSSSEESDG
jgi:hypothetical protein